MYRVRHLLLISPDLVEHIESATLAREDVLGGFAPDEGLVCVVLQQIIVDRVLQIVDAGVAATADALCGDLGEEALDKVHPRRAGGGEVQLEPGVLFQPSLHLGRLVGGVVIENQVDAARFLHGSVDAAQEAKELPGTVAWHALPDDQARFDVQRSKERGRAMALVVVGHRGGAPLLQRQSRLRPIKRLDLGLFIDAEHDCTVRWIEIEADDLGNLLLEHRVVRDLEALHDMRPQPGLCPDAAHARRRNPDRLGHQRTTPVRGIARALLHGLRDHPQPDLPGQGRHPRRPRLVPLEPRHALIEIPFLPAPDRRLRHARPSHDLHRPRAIGRLKHDTCAPSELACRVAVGAQSFKLSAVGGAKVKADVGASHSPFMSRLSGTGNPMSGGKH
jgi:hypothetical protein